MSLPDVPVGLPAGLNDLLSAMKESVENLKGDHLKNDKAMTFDDAVGLGLIDKNFVGNILDDYEEGTYTATLTCGTSGTITINPLFDSLSYTKIGRQVTVIGDLIIDSVSSPLGALILNLPFAMGSTPELSEYFTGYVLHYNINALGAGGNLAIRASIGSDVNIVEQLSNSYSNDAADHIQAASQLTFGFSYFTA